MQLLKEIPRSRAEWIVWVDMDIIIDRMDFQIPVPAYEGKDFVIWGRQDKISKGDVLNGKHYCECICNMCVNDIPWERSAYAASCQINLAATPVYLYCLSVCRSEQWCFYGAKHRLVTQLP